MTLNIQQGIDVSNNTKFTAVVLIFQISLYQIKINNKDREEFRHNMITGEKALSYKPIFSMQYFNQFQNAFKR